MHGPRRQLHPLRGELHHFTFPRFQRAVAMQCAAAQSRIGTTLASGLALRGATYAPPHLSGALGVTGLPQQSGGPGAVNPQLQIDAIQ